MKARIERSKASQAVIQLREALGMSQQRFAVEELKSALNTVGRYETTNPPSGDALLRLADIAEKHNLAKLAGRFRTLWFRERLEDRPRTLEIDPDDNTGWLIMKLHGREQLDAAIDFFESQREDPIDNEWLEWKKSVGYKGRKHKSK